MDYHASLSEHLSWYPLAELQDVYKYFHQAYFGPGHLVKDSGQVIKMLNQELESIKESDLHLLVPLGKPAFFYRVNLSLILTGFIQQNEMAEAFLESAMGSHPEQPVDWLTEWDKIQAVAQAHFSDAVEYRRQQNILQEQLDLGRRVFSHSETFRQSYQPHYRVISIDQIRSRWQHLLNRYELQ